MQQNRRAFIKSAGALTALQFVPFNSLIASVSPAVSSRKQPGVVRGAFFYPPAEVVLQGRNEDSWQQHQWFTWPGNQFKPEEQQARFVRKVGELSTGLDLRIELDPQAIYTDAGVARFIASLEANKPAALLLFNFWNTFSPKVRKILDAWAGPAIVYHPVGANHQLPPNYFRNQPRLHYIHSIENWDSLGRGLRAVHAMNRMRQSTILRVSGKPANESEATEEFFRSRIKTVPAETFNRIFDNTKVDRELERLARSVRKGARKVTDLADSAFHDAVRSHASVREIMARYEADAITIECLFLKHRKPCLSFAINNGALVPCACENHLEATLTLMVGAHCFGRGGFQHNPEYDTERNLYFASHCTCAMRLRGPQEKAVPYHLRPFFHQMPKTLALDVQWPPGEPVTLCKYVSKSKAFHAWQGSVISSPECPPTGGCATRVLIRLDGMPDICTAYAGPHPVLYCGHFGQHLKTLGRLYEIGLVGNV